MNYASARRCLQSGLAGIRAGCSLGLRPGSRRHVQRWAYLRQSGGESFRRCGRVERSDAWCAGNTCWCGERGGPREGRVRRRSAYLGRPIGREVAKLTVKQAPFRALAKSKDKALASAVKELI